MIRLALRTRLTLWFAASLTLILSPFLAGVLALEWRSMRAALDHHLSEDLEVASEMLVLRGDDLAWRTETDRDFGYDGGEQRWVEAYALDGRPLYFRGLARREAIRAAMPVVPHETEGFRTLRTPAGAHVRTLVAQRRLGPARVWIRVARTEDDLRQNLRRLLLIFAVAAPLAVFGTAVAGHLIAGRALAPLARMADRARSISAEHLSERLPVENERDEPGQLAVVFNDTFARLEASFHRLKRFTADASHELRTPLTAIRSVGEVGLRETRDPAAYREIIGSMLEETDRLSRLVDTLLTLSRWESGRVRPAPAAVDLGALAREVAGQLAVLAEERRVGIDVSIEGRLTVAADPVMIAQALMNVLDNAIRFSPEDGQVRIWARTDVKEHHLIVDDEGPGIPPGQRERVLERFYRIDDGRARGDGGAGLGLAIVQWAVSANEGRIVIDESAAGGARLILSFPRSRAES